MLLQVCSETYGVCPDVVLSGDVSALLAYIPAHLDYMLYELLKNGARAVVEGAAIRPGQGLLAKLPPILASARDAGRALCGLGPSGRWALLLAPPARTSCLHLLLVPPARTSCLYLLLVPPGVVMCIRQQTQCVDQRGSRRSVRAREAAPPLLADHCCVAPCRCVCAPAPTELSSASVTMAAASRQSWSSRCGPTASVPASSRWWARRSSRTVSSMCLTAVAWLEEQAAAVGAAQAAWPACSRMHRWGSLTWHVTCRPHMLD
jgi:hypothetical protein